MKHFVSCVSQVLPPAGYMYSPGTQQSSVTPTFMEDLEDPNPPIDPETVNKEFYNLDKVYSSEENPSPFLRSDCPRTNPKDTDS